MSVKAAHTSRWEIAEVVFGIPFLISLALHWILPFSLPPGGLRQALIPIGILLIGLGFGLIVLARREFAAFSQPTDPGQPTSRLVKTGVFAISRNPLYLGAISIFFGLALALNLLWVLVLLLLSIVICFYVLIRPEEQYLAARFGEEYTDYTAAVHRWLGRH